MATLQLKKIYKKFGKLEIVHGIDLEIKNNEFVVLVGPSGCGKSTTLRMIAGLEEITDGELMIDGQLVNNLAPKDRNIAMVFQNYALYPHMNVFDNMSFGLRLQKVPKAEIQERVQKSADILGLTSLLDRKPSQLSGGQRQRVAMGRAIVRNPKVFLFDEPLSNLDAKLRIQMRAEIKLLHQRFENTTTVYVTHDQVEAMTLADRIVVMRNGYIEQVGTPLELFSKPVNTFVAGFIGNPPMNLQSCTVVKEGDGLALDFAGKFKIPVPKKPGMQVKAGQAVMMGIRPEDMLVDSIKAVKQVFKIKTKVEVVEPLGSETLVHISLASGYPFIAKLEGRRNIHHGEEAELSLDLEHLHIFDVDSTQSVY